MKRAEEKMCGEGKDGGPSCAHYVIISESANGCPEFFSAVSSPLALGQERFQELALPPRFFL